MKRTLILFTFLFCLFVKGNCQIISTIAGNGTSGYTGDGGLATGAEINMPWDVAIDGAGNTYIGGYSPSPVLRKINAAGIISTFAGNGSFGFSGDGGQATTAQLEYPWGVATDAAGNVYISDAGEYRIRKVNTSGIIQTIAGNGTSGLSGDGGPATAAMISNYGGVIASDPYGNIYISEYGYNKIRKIDTFGIITTIAGNGIAGFSGDGGPATAAELGGSGWYINGLAADRYGNIYISDEYNSRIRKVNSSGIISTIAGTSGSGITGDGGPATAAHLSIPFGIALDTFGNLYINDVGNGVVRKVNTFGIISLFAGMGPGGFTGDGGPATAAEFNLNYGLATDIYGNVYVGDYDNVRIRKITIYNLPLEFTAGHHNNLSVCENSTYNSINSLLAVYDSSTGITATWSLISGPAHGSAIAAYTATTSAGILTPTGLSYTPSAGYYGIDTFKVRVTDGISSDTTTVAVNITRFEAGIITGLSIECPGNTITLTDTASGGTWSSSNPSIAVVSGPGIVTGISAGNVLISYSVTGTCGTVSALAKVSVGNPVINTIAGNGTAGFTGDGGAATAAEIYAPACAVTDATGNIYICDYSNNRIRKVGATGNITTFAGNGISGYSGDGGQATAAELNHPTGIYADGSGNLFIADFSNNRIRKVNSSGVITTIAGTGTTGYSGDGGAATAAHLNEPSCLVGDAAGNIYFTDGNNCAVRVINTSGIITTIAGNGTPGYSGDGGPATAAHIWFAFGIALDAANNLYIADQFSNRVRKISTSGIITTVAGSGATGSGTGSYTGDGGAATAATMKNPSGVYIDPAGNMVISDYYNNVIRYVNTSGIISTIAGTGTGGFSGDGGAPTSAQIYHPNNIWEDAGGNIYIPDATNNRVREITMSGGSVAPVTGPVIVCPGNTITLTDSTSGGTWSSSNSTVATVTTGGVVTGIVVGNAVISYAVTSSCGTVYAKHPVMVGLPDITTIAGAGSSGFGGDGGPATAALLNNPHSMFMDTSGNVIIADIFNNRIRKINSSGIISTIAGTGIAGFGGDGGAATAAVLNTPWAITKDATGNIYVSDNLNNRVRKISSTGIISTIAGTGTAGFAGDGGPATAALLHGPAGLAFDGSGNLYIGEFNNDRVRKINTAGIITTIAGTGVSGFSGDGGAATAATFNQLNFVQTDASGNVYITDNGNHRIRRVNSAGIVTTVAGNGTIGGSGDGGAATAAQLDYPGNVTFDAAGNMYIATDVTEKIRVVNTSGIISTYAGTGTIGFTGDGGPATAATMHTPVDVSFDNSGNLLIADQQNNAIRKIYPGGVVSVSTVTGLSTVCAGNILVLSDSTSGGIWSSSDTTKATVSSSGIVTGISAGTATITYSVTFACGTLYRTKTIIVNPLPAALSPAGASICTGNTVTFTETTTGGVWSTGTSSIATVSGGVAAGVGSGVTTISYTLTTGCATGATITVNPLPSSITGASFLCIGNSVPESDSIAGGTWSSSYIVVAPVVPATGVVTGISVGTAIITYLLPTGCLATKSVTVYPMPGPPVGPTTVCAGSSITLSDGGGGIWTTTSTNITLGTATGVVTGVTSGSAVITYTLSTGCFITRPVTVNANPLPITGTSVLCSGTITYLSDGTPGGTWTSSNPYVASVTPLMGVVTGISGGTATITYILSTGCYTTFTVTINQTPSAITGLTSICAGISTTLSDSVTGGTWSTSDVTIAPIVAASGVYTGYSPGNATITYAMATGCSVTTTVTINAMPGTISGITSVCVGLNTTLSDGVPGGTWSSASLPVATVDPATGIVLGVTPGAATIFYTLPDGCAVSTTVTVNNTAGAIAGPSQVCLNGNITLTDPSGGGIWTSSAPATAMIGFSSGILTGLLTGTVTVTYAIGAGCSATKVITVNPLPALITGTTVVCVGSTTTLSDPTSGGTWSSSIATNGSISASGVLSGIAAGNTVIDYTLTATGCSRSVTATVNPQPAVISGPSVVCPGATITLTDATPGGIWGMSGGSVSVGSSTGVVTGTATGIATVTYTLSTGCVQTKQITVNPLPAAISGPTSLCQGSTTTLTDAGGGIWSAISGAATIGSTSGLVTGTSAGTALITYTISTGCFVTRAETVNPLPAAIGGPSALCVGSTITLTDGGGGTWSSMTTTIATIGTTTGIVSGAATGTTTIVYTLPTGCTTAEIVTVSTTPTAISGSPTVCAGSSTTLSDAIAGGLWTSTNPAAATIGSLSGIVAGVAVGVTTISYSLGSGCTVAKTITVTASPAAISGGSSVCISGTTAMTDATPGGTWSISPVTTGTISATGVVTGVAAGVATIDYTAAECSATKPVTINNTPTAITGSGTVCMGSITTDADAVAGGTWSTSGTAISVGSGSGIVSGISAGMGTLSYSIGSCSVSRTITVNPVPSITGSMGLCTGTTTTLTSSIPGCTWSSSGGVITVGSTSGLVTALSPGTATTICFSLAGCSASVVVTVNGTPGTITGTLHVCAGATTTLSDGTGGGIWSISPGTTASIGSTTGIVNGILTGTATATYSLGSGCTVTSIVTVNAVPAAITGTAQVCAGLTTSLSDATTGGTWSSGSFATGTISSTGIVTGIVAGSTTISYTVIGCSATYPVTVNPLPSPITGTSGLCAGLTAPFTDITTGGIWSAGTGGVSVGSGSGMVTGVSAGTATITYTLPTGCLATKPITINSAPAAISGSAMVCIGSSIVLTDGTSGGTWSSSVPTAATVGISGIVTGSSVGTTVISYIVGGCPATKTITVNSLPGAITGPAIVCISATVTATDAGGGLWSSSNPVIATIGSSTGVITGVAAGTATITYSLGAGCTATELITVNALPAAITGSSSNVCLGATLALADATPGGVWLSGSTAIASVSTTGVVSGVSGGVSIITYKAPSGCAVTDAIAVISVAPISGVHNICAYGDTMTVSDVPGTGLYLSSLATVTNLGGGLGLVTGHTPGSASVTYMLPSGCTAMAVFTVNPLPAVIAGSGHICSGSIATLTDATPGGTWSTSGTGILAVGSLTGIVTGVAGGTGYITYTLASTGCKVDTAEGVYTTPTAIAGSSSLFLGTPITLSDVVTGGIWTSSNVLVATVGTGTGHVTGISVGSVTITYATGGICPVTKYLTVMPSAGRSGPLGVHSGETERGNAVRVSPNPGDGGFTIDLNWATEETVHITISNVAGMKIKDWSAATVKDGTVSIPVQIDVASGVYVLSVEGIDYRYVTKVVVER